METGKLTTENLLPLTRYESQLEKRTTRLNSCVPKQIKDTEEDVSQEMFAPNCRDLYSSLIFIN